MAQSGKNYDVIVLGAGAAGLMCAMTAAQRGRRVLVVEKANKVGKKILMSGGGRCNFTNHFVEAENYISTNPHFCKSALNRYTQWDFISMVERHGIDYEERKHSQLFCINSAKEILAMLLEECELAGVEIKTDCDIEKITALPEAKGPLQMNASALDSGLALQDFANFPCPTHAHSYTPFTRTLTASRYHSTRFPRF